MMTQPCCRFCRCCCCCCCSSPPGAQFIECCDIVLTADLVAVCRHEPDISNTTNANDLYPNRVSTFADVSLVPCWTLCWCT
jgi:hypothetical protein